MENIVELDLYYDLDGSFNLPDEAVYEEPLNKEEEVTGREQETIKPNWRRHKTLSSIFPGELKNLQNKLEGIGEKEQSKKLGINQFVVVRQRTFTRTTAAALEIELSTEDFKKALAAGELEDQLVWLEHEEDSEEVGGVDNVVELDQVPESTKKQLKSYFRDVFYNYPF